MKKLMFLSLVMFGFNLSASEISCEFEKVYRAVLSFEGTKSSLVVYKKNEKILQCRVTLMNNDAPQAKHASSHSGVMDFKLLDCVVSNPKYKNEIAVGTVGMMTSDSKKSYLTFSTNHDTAICKNK